MARVHKYENAAEFMADLRARGMQVSMVHDQVVIDPSDQLAGADREQILLHKQDMLCELWREKRCDPALQHTCARVVERELMARPGVLEARVWDYKEEWFLQIDFDMSSEEVYETDLEIRGTLSKAVNTLYEHSTGRVRVREASWWHYNDGEPPTYLLSVEGLVLETVVAEAKRLQEELDAFDMDDYIAQ
jgi:hypothetical protein